MSSYNAPPAYQSKTYGTNDSAAADPLLGRAGPSNGIYNQPNPGDLPDDFKVGLHSWALTPIAHMHIGLFLVLVSGIGI